MEEQEPYFPIAGFCHALIILVVAQIDARLPFTGFSIPCKMCFRLGFYPADIGAFLHEQIGRDKRRIRRKEVRSLPFFQLKIIDRNHAVPTAPQPRCDAALGAPADGK